MLYEVITEDPAPDPHVVEAGHGLEVADPEAPRLGRGRGADRQVVDYTQEDLFRNGQRYDLILDNVGNYTLSDLRRLLTPTGILQPTGGGHSNNRWSGPRNNFV